MGMVYYCMISGWIRRLFTPTGTARKAARTYFASQCPEWTFLGTSVRAIEEDRTVVALLYEAPPVRTKPCRYLLYAVSSIDGSVEELPCSPDSPYWITGRR